MVVKVSNMASDVSSVTLSTEGDISNDTRNSVETLELDKFDALVDSVENAEKIDSDEVTIGIDLGTKNCCVAFYGNQSVTVIPNDLRKKTTPSYVLLQKSGVNAVGAAVKSEAFLNPNFTIFDSKRMIGRLATDKNIQRAAKYWPFKVNDIKGFPMIVGRNNISYSPEQISGILVKHCIDLAEKHLGKKVSSAVITVPAYFKNNHKKATIRAGVNAGLKKEKLWLLSEPTAAAIAYRLKTKILEPKQILVFDLGGGTFDVAVVEISQNKIKVIATDGDSFLGGEDFDTVLVEHCKQRFKKKHKMNIHDSKKISQASRSLISLREECEKKKIHLDTLECVTIYVSHIIGGVDLEVKVTRAEYQRLTDHLIDQMIDIVKRTLKSNNLNISDIDDVLLVGASTNAPRLQERLKIFFNREHLNSRINPDESVAYGAAVYAVYMNNSLEMESGFEITQVQDVVCESIGIRIKSGNVRNRFSRIIVKNTVYPCHKQEIYCTVEDNQDQVKISIYQGENDFASNNTFLEDIKLVGIPKSKAGEQRISVSMRLDSNGILKVTASCISTGKSKSCQVETQM